MNGAVVTGASGFVGRALTAELRRQGVRVLAVSRAFGGVSQDSGILPVRLDLEHLAELPDRTRERWDVFYHLAWDGTAGDGRRDVFRQLSNAEATVQAVQVAEQLGCHRFIGAGSIMEKELLAASVVPQVRPGGSHIYSAAKLTAHHMSRCMAAELGIDHIWAVITNAYGEGEASPRLINTTLRKLQQGEALHFTAATQQYDFIHVQDVARALYLLGEYGTPFAEYTIGSGAPRPLKAFLKELCEVAGAAQPPMFGSVPFQGVSLPPEAFDTTPLCKDTGFAPQVGFSQGIRRTMQWLAQQLPEDGAKAETP